MSSLSSPRGSPRNDPRRRFRRGHGPTRSSSFFGAIKKLVAAPFAWLNDSGEFEDNPGKRRRNGRPSPEPEAGEHRTKRKRLHSPEASPPHTQMPQTSFQQETPAIGYLDVPDNLIRPMATSRTRLTGHGRSSSLAVPYQQQLGQYNRHSHSPTGSTSYVQPARMVRTQSMDPPSLLGASSRGAVQTSPALSRDVSMESAYQPYGRDVAMSATRSPFRLRTSLTPQPAGQVFGPTIHHRERDPSDPPPLTSLISNPVFVKPPRLQQQSQPLAQQPTFTLGSLAETQRRDGSPMRQRSTLLLSRSGSTIDMASSSATSLRQISAAERALHDLDVYKTPLLPSRLRGSDTIPDMFKPKRMPTPVLMTKRHDDKPPLGMSEKQKGKIAEQESAGVKPYAGQGGIKKLLARRRQEEREQEQEAVIITDQENGEEDEDVQRTSVHVNVTTRKADAEPTESEFPTLRHIAFPDFTSIPATGRATSLRVGRSATNRNHISHPFARPKNRFSARYDDDESEDSMSTSQSSPALENMVKPPAPLFQVPAGFSFAKDSAPIEHDISGAKEPPIAALPFSLSKSTTASASAAPSSSAKPTAEPTKTPVSVFAQLSQGSTPAPPPTVVAASSTAPTSAPAPSTPMLSVVPSISFTPATPRPPAPVASSEPAESLAPSTSTAAAPAVPNFFANSSIFSKPGVTITPPTSSSAPPAAVASAEDRGKIQADGVSREDTPVPAFQLPQTSIFGSSSSTAFSSTESKSNLSVETNKPSSQPLFGGSSTGTASSLFGGSSSGTGTRTSFFGTPTTAKEPSVPTLAPSLLVDTSVKPPAPAATPSFSFGAPPKSAEQPEATKSFTLDEPAKAAKPTVPPTSESFSFGATPKPAEPSVASSSFSFGTPTPAETKEAEQKSTLQPSLFPNTPASASSFGGFGVTAANGSSVEAPKTGFSFGRPATSPATNTPTVESPKPLFGGDTSGGFSFTRPSSSSAAEAPSSAKSPFTFGASPATPPITSGEKPAFSFGAPPPATSGGSGQMLFGAPAGSSNSTDVLKPFSFGAPVTPTRPVTPPRNDQEVLMDESPMRGGGMDINGSGGQEAPKPSGGFAFGAPSTSGTSLFGQPNQSASSSFAFGAAPASSPFGAKPELKAEVKPASTFGGFGSSTSTGFGGFGQKESTQSPLSPSLFGSSTPFGQPTSTPTAASSTFAFGTPSGGGNAFSQAAANGPSAPTSPSTFGAPNAFSFGTPTSATAPSNPFGFASSQPASPAGVNAGLPQSATAPNSSFSFGQQSPATPQAPVSPFGAPPAALPPAEGGALFTMGAAPAPATRAIKKLPNRRGLKR